MDGQAATGLRVKIYDDRVRVEAWDFKDGHSLLNPEGEAKMIKYQDFSKQRRLSAPPVQPAEDNTPAAAGSSTGEKVALALGILAVLGGSFAFVATHFGQQIRALSPVPLPQF